MRLVGICQPLLILSVLALQLVAIEARAGEKMYGVESGSDALWIVDVDTGHRTLVGPLDPDPARFTTPVSMATRPSDGEIFVINNTYPDEGLATVDWATGLATRIGGDPMNGLAFDAAGTLYSQVALSFGSIHRGPIGTVDPATGSITSLGGPDLRRLFGLAFDDVEGNLMGVTYAYDLLTLDPTTGEVLETTPLLGDFRGVPGTLVFDFAGRLIGTDIGQGLFDIDLYTGEVSGFTPLDDGNQGLGRILPD
jgi:hypothetical protein